MQPLRASDLRDQIGPYVLVKAIGAGGSARVDLARIERAYGFQRHVVIKRPLEHLRNDVRASEGLRREARLGARLRHPNLVAILDAGVHAGYDYLVLEYVHGGALRTLMQTEEGSRVRDVPLEVAITIVRDVARGLHEAHELHDERGAPLGLVHRDVSPGNVLVGVDGAVKLADFGIAKETRVATLSGSMHGTVTYMAPEQCRGHAFDRRADVFSLGVILYELVTGTRLFWADNDVASLHRVLAGTITRPRKLRPSIAVALEDIIMSAVAHEQHQRFPTARALADALESYGTTAGHILAARSVARWAQEIVGPHDHPWLDDTDVDPGQTLESPRPSMIEEPARPLVALIQAAPPVDEPLLPTFGPTDARMNEEGPSQRATAAASAPRPRRTGVVVGVLGVSVLLGVGLGVLAAGGHEEPVATTPAVSPAPAPAPVVPMPAPAPTPAPPPRVDPVVEPTVPETAPSGSDTPTTTPGDVSPEPSKRRPRPPRGTVAAGAGSGSAIDTSKSTPKVEWNPGMLLPTDPAATPKKR